MKKLNVLMLSVLAAIGSFVAMPSECLAQCDQSVVSVNQGPVTITGLIRRHIRGSDGVWYYEPAAGCVAQLVNRRGQVFGTAVCSADGTCVFVGVPRPAFYHLELFDPRGRGRTHWSSTVHVRLRDTTAEIRTTLRYLR